MSQSLPTTIHIVPTSSRSAGIIAAALGLAALLFAGDAWLSGASNPTIYLLVFGLPSGVFVLLALLARMRSLELANGTLRESAWSGHRIIHLQGIVGLSLRVRVQGRIVTRRLIVWDADERERGQIDITDYRLAHVRRLIAQMLVHSPNLTLDRELQRYLELIGA